MASGTIVTPSLAATSTISSQGTYFTTATDDSLLISTSAAVTIFGGGAMSETVQGSNGNLTFEAGSNTAFISAGDGADLIVGPTLGTSNLSLALGNGNDELFLSASAANILALALGGGNDIVAFGGGTGTISATGTTDIFLGSGTVAASANIATGQIITGSGNAAITLTGGADTVWAAGSGKLSVNGGNAASFLYVGGAAAATVTGGSGSTTIFGDSIAGGVYTAGTGGNSFVVAGGRGETLNGVANGDVLWSSSDLTIMNAGAGNETLGATGVTQRDQINLGTGNDLLLIANFSDTVNLGSGNATIILQPSFTQTTSTTTTSGVAQTGLPIVSGSEQINVTRGNAGGNINLVGFGLSTTGTNEYLHLIGFSTIEGANALANQVHGSSGGTVYTQLQLSDNTTLTFWGRSSLSSAFQ